MKHLKTLGIIALVGAMAAGPAFAEGGLATLLHDGADSSGTSGASAGGAHSNGSGGIQKTVRRGEITLAGGGQCYLTTHSGRTVLVACPAGVGTDS